MTLTPPREKSLADVHENADVYEDRKGNSKGEEGGTAGNGTTGNEATNGLTKNPGCADSGLTKKPPPSEYDDDDVDPPSSPEEVLHHTTIDFLNTMWNFMAEPLLFAVIGTALDFRKINPSILPRSVFLVLLCVFCVRVPMAVLATCGGGFSLRERLFIGLSWMPKATVQAALGSVPLDMVRAYLQENDDGSDAYKQQIIWGENVVTTAILSILITAPAGLIVIAKLGPRMLTKDVGAFGAE